MALSYKSIRAETPWDWVYRWNNSDGHHPFVEKAVKMRSVLWSLIKAGTCHMTCLEAQTLSLHHKQASDKEFPNQLSLPVHFQPTHPHGERSGLVPLRQYLCQFPRAIIVGSLPTLRSSGQGGGMLCQRQDLLEVQPCTQYGHPKPLGLYPKGTHGGEG